MARKADASPDGKSDDKAKDEPKGPEAKPEAKSEPKAEGDKGDKGDKGDPKATRAKSETLIDNDPSKVEPSPWGDEPPAISIARTSTSDMPPQKDLGAPPPVPAVVAPSVLHSDATAVEDPTFLPHPRDVPDGVPSDPAPAPGRVPRGDSRCFRRRTERFEFALIYRIATFIITRVGTVGTRGVWRVVEYPTGTSASHAYAKECSRFVSEGFSDYRD